MVTNRPLLRIGVFYDGQYFFKVSNYYAYQHECRSRIAIGGLHRFIQSYAAKTLSLAPEDCCIVSAQYFRGRLAARDANSSGALFYERAFDDVLISEGVSPHYLPLMQTCGRKQEKGIDVWLALEAYEIAMSGCLDMIALIACDGDYIPLVRKLNALGVRVMLLGWNVQYRDECGEEREIKTSQDLLEAVNIPIHMNKLLDHAEEIPDLFVPLVGRNQYIANTSENDFRVSEIVSLSRGYGFIKEQPTNLFFHHSGLINCDYYDLYQGDQVKYRVTLYEDKWIATDIEKIN